VEEGPELNPGESVLYLNLGVAWPIGKTDEASRSIKRLWRSPQCRRGYFRWEWLADAGKLTSIAISASLEIRPSKDSDTMMRQLII